MYQLTNETMLLALSRLAEQDATLAAVYQEHGVPPMWIRSQSFSSLVHIVLEQKVSIISANAVMKRVKLLCPEMRADLFMQVADEPLRNAGFSASKLSYCRSIAQAILDRSLDLKKLQQLPNDQVIATLTKVRGIGPWSAGVYLMMAMKRPDAWASGDRALAVSYAQSAELDQVPDYASLDEIALKWSPHRGTAARLLWHAYLRRKERK